MSEYQARLNGVSQADIDDVTNTPGMASVVFKESSISMDLLRDNYDVYTKSSTYAKGHPTKGTIVLRVTIPEHPGQWAIKVTDALANERGCALTLEQGPNRIAIADVEAGNTLVALFALEPDGQCTTYFQEAYALLRKNLTAEINMEFGGGKNSPNRYRIGYLGIGQNSQSVLENLPLQQNRDAMVRIMVYDSYGQGMNRSHTLPVQVSWSLPGGIVRTEEFQSHISGRHASSGRLNAAADTYTLGYVIPAAYIQPGLQISAKLLKTGTSEVLHEVAPIPVDVVPPRTINIYGYETKPRFGSGVPVARSNARWNEEMMPFTRSAFPYATINYSYKGSVVLGAMLPFGGTVAGAYNHVMIMTYMNSLADWLPTDFWGNDNYRLNLGIMNDRYSDKRGGMCWPWRPGISLAAEHGLPYQKVAYTLAHEMGHAFGLDHAPSKDADGNDANGYFLGLHVNRVDNNYPYGGGSMAGGWGYVDFKYKEGSLLEDAKYFLSEDAHTIYQSCRAHWDMMAYLADYARTFRTNRFSDYNQRNMLGKLKLDSPNATSCSQEADNAFANFPVLPGTNTKIFGPEQAHAAEEAWHREFGVRSIYAVDPARMGSTPLDLDPSTITVTSDGRVIMPAYNATDDSIPIEFAHLVKDGYEIGDGVGRPQVNDPIGDPGGYEDGDEPPFMIVTRLPRLLGLNVIQ
jgi:hypothetical protein